MTIRAASSLSILTSTALVALLTSGCIIRETPVYTDSRIYENPPAPLLQANGASPDLGTAQPPTAQAPADNPPTGFAYAPDLYLWDGYEYVGVYNDQYVYWSGSSWSYCDPSRVDRFLTWVREHADWLLRAGPYGAGSGLRRR